jgi:phage head maturation protease
MASESREPMTNTRSKMMASYTIEFNGSGEVSEGQFRNDTDAQVWVESVLESRGHDVDALVSGDWDAAGKNDDGEQCYRMLFWASESDAENDAGEKSVCQLCKVC